MKKFMTIIHEIAQRPSDHENLALLVKISPIAFTIIFYDTELFRTSAMDYAQLGQKKPRRLIEALRKCLVASMSLTKSETSPWGAWTVVYAKARKGSGPMMYDYAMKRLGAIMSDRSDVSMEARNVWKKYFERKDVVHLMIDDIENPKTPSPEDDGQLFTKRDPRDPLNYVYRAVNRSTSEYISAENLNRKCLSDAEQQSGLQKKALEQAIIQASLDEFSDISTGAQ